MKKTVKEKMEKKIGSIFIMNFQWGKFNDEFSSYILDSRLHCFN